jgi:hypothetical protein
MSVIQVTKEFIEETDKLRIPKSDSLLEGSSQNVAFFASKMLGIRLRAWQVYALNRITDPDAAKKFFVMITSRQIGKSMSAAIFTLWATTFNKFPGGLENNTSICIISAGEKQAQKLLREIKKLIRMGDTYMKITYKNEDGTPIFGEEFFTDLIDDNGANNTTTITFKAYDNSVHGLLLKDSKSGSTVVSYPPTSVVLGETFSLVIVDEAGKTDKISDEFFYEFLLPTGDHRRAKFLILSTPWQVAGFFYRMVNPDGIYEDMDNVDVFSFDITAIELEGPEDYELRLKEINKLNSDGKNAEVQRAYYCRFVKGDINYFDPDKVHEIFSKQYRKYDEYKLPVDLGIDFGSERNSHSVLTFSHIDNNGVIHRIFDRAYKPNGDLDMIKDIATYRKLFNVQRIVVDDCAEGHYRIKEMELLGWDITRMQFRKDKVIKYSAFRGKVNRGLVKSYVDDELKTEMLALENNPKRARSLIGAPPGYNDDRIDSFVISCYYFLEDEEDHGFIGVDKKEEKKLSETRNNIREMIERSKRRQRSSRWF